MRSSVLPRLAAAVLACLICTPSAVFGQSSNGSIHGVVTDSSGAAIVGADLNLRSTDSDSIAKATSGVDGEFSFPNLPGGNYQLKVAAKGFKEFVQTGIVVHLNDSVSLPVALQVGEASQTVEVNANASPLNFENGEVKGTIAKREILALPLQVGGRLGLHRVDGDADEPAVECEHARHGIDPAVGVQCAEHAVVVGGQSFQRVVVGEPHGVMPGWRRSRRAVVRGVRA